MDTLHTVLRSIRGETMARRDHIDVFREFLDQLDRAARREQPPRNTRPQWQSQAREMLTSPSSWPDLIRRSMGLCGEPERCVYPWVKPGADGRILLAA